MIKVNKSIKNSQPSQLHGNQTKTILNKDRDGKASPLSCFL